MTFTIPHRLPGLNELIAKERRNRYVGAKFKKKITRECAQWAIAGGVPIFQAPVDIAIAFYEPDRRRDADNIRAAGEKYILDGLVQARRLGDDSQRHIASLASVVRLDPVRPRVEISINPSRPDEGPEYFLARCRSVGAV